MSGNYTWPKDPEGYVQERPTASEKHQALNAAAGPGRWRQRGARFSLSAKAMGRRVRQVDLSR